MMRRPRRVVAVMVGLVLGLSAIGPGAPTVVSAQSGELGSGGEYHSIRPRMVLDAREGSRVGLLQAPLPTSRSGVRTEIDLSDVRGLPADPADVLAVAVEVMVKNATRPGDLVLFSGDIATAPLASSLMFTADRPTSTTVFVRPSPDGVIALAGRTARAGTAEVRVSVVGWVATTSSGLRGSRLVTTAPFAVFPAFENVLTAREIVSLDIRGVGPVPDLPVVDGVVLNVTVLNNRTDSVTNRVTVTSTRPTRIPRIPDMVVAAGQISSMMMIVPLDEEGRVHLANKAGSADAIVHVVGFTRSVSSTTSRIGRIVPLDRPFRAFDTRSDAAGDLPLGPGQAESWAFAETVDTLSYPGGGSVGEVGALLGTFTGLGHRRQYPANPPSTTELRVYIGRLSPMSNVFVGEKQRVSNGIVGRLTGTDEFTVYNRAGFTDYLFDISAIVLES